MRVYLTTTIEETKRIWDKGFRNLHQEFGMTGVWFATTQLDANDGFPGEVTLCLDVPEDVFEEYEVDDPTHPSYREALIPTDALNKIGKPMVYDHLYAGVGRRQLLQSAEHWEQGDVASYLHGDEMRAAIKFFGSSGEFVGQDWPCEAEWSGPLRAIRPGPGSLRRCPTIRVQVSEKTIESLRDRFFAPL